MLDIYFHEKLLGSQGGSDTADCMLNQGCVLRKISDKVYRIPYIGKSAAERQLEIAKKELTVLKEEIKQNQMSLQNINEVIALMDKCALKALQSTMGAPSEKRVQLSQKRKLEMELEEAKKNPNLISLYEKGSSLTKKLNEKRTQIEGIQRRENNKERDIREHETEKCTLFLSDSQPKNRRT